MCVVLTCEHRLKTLRNGIGNAISNAIESRVPTSVAAASRGRPVTVKNCRFLC